MPETKKKTETVEKTEKTESAFSKEQILQSAKYKGQRDLADALLETGKEYTFQAVDRLIQNYRKGEVN